MNSEQFLKEVLASDICPDNFEQIYSEFQQYQKLACDTLKEFHRVCEKNHIDYQLAYGSLLGAVRDNGQIPWDYDIDVFVPFEQKEGLVEALSRDLDNKFMFYCPENNKKCRHVIMRLAPKGYNTAALHVDVFYLVGTPSDQSEKEQFISKIKKLADDRYHKLVKISEESQNWKITVVMALYKLKLMTKSTDRMMKKYNKICMEYPMYHSNICVSADSFADWYDFPTEYFKKTKLIKNDLGTFRIPVHYEEILTLIYGDYQKIYPLENRLNEMMNFYNRLKKMAKL